VWCADVGSANNRPRRVIPERGQVCGDNVEASPEVGGHVLQDDDSGSKYTNGFGDPGPEVSGVIGALSLAGVGERLAWVAGREEVDRLDGRPVDELQVAKVRRVGVVLHDLYWAGFDVRPPREFAAEDGLRRHVESAVARAEGAVLHARPPARSTHSTT
jgi:hypothetical protein